jgi:putative transposase
VGPPRRIKGCWVPHDTRDEIVDYIGYWTNRAELPAKPASGGLSWLQLGTSKFHQWKHRYGIANEHNGQVPRDYWLEDWERKAIVEYYGRHPWEGYRRLTFMMLDDDVVAVSPTSVYRVLKAGGWLDRKWWSPSKKGTGFVSAPGGLKPHEHWHVDVCYINVQGTFYFLITVLDGFPPSADFIVHWELRESMKEAEIELVLQKALEKFPGVTPRIISDNPPAADSSWLAISKSSSAWWEPLTCAPARTIRKAIRRGGLERWHGSLKRECIRPSCPGSLPEARQRIAGFVEHYNTVRLHASLGYITPADKLAGLDAVIFDGPTFGRCPIASSKRLANDDNKPDSPPGRLPDDSLRATTTIGLGGGYGSAEVQPERRPRDWCEGRTGPLPARPPHHFTSTPKRKTCVARRHTPHGRMPLTTR